MIMDKPTVHTSLYSDGPISGTSFAKIGGFWYLLSIYLNKLNI